MDCMGTLNGIGLPCFGTVMPMYVRRTLFLCNSRTTNENMQRIMTFKDDHTRDAIGWIDTVRVDVPGAGWP